jgi:hypothetical protein
MVKAAELVNNFLGLIAIKRSELNNHEYIKQ